MQEGLAPHTGYIFDSIANMDCIRQFVLVGGTALSLQIGNRQSEDLDFMKWRTNKTERMEVDWYGIQQELSTISHVESTNLMGFDHVEFRVDGVKLSFYASPRFSPVTSPVHIKGNMYAADLVSIGAMKMEVLLRRVKFRDYYDIYSLLRHGVDINEMVDLSLKHSEHKLKKKNLIAMLSNGAGYVMDANFDQLSPKYSVTAKDIEGYIREMLLQSN